MSKTTSKIGFLVSDRSDTSSRSASHGYGAPTSLKGDRVLGRPVSGKAGLAAVDKGYAEAIVATPAVTQAIQGAADAARIVGAHFRGLIEQGVPEDYARELNREFATTVNDLVKAGIAAKKGS